MGIVSSFPAIGAVVGLLAAVPAFASGQPGSAAPSLSPASPSDLGSEERTYQRFEDGRQAEEDAIESNRLPARNAPPPRRLEVQEQAEGDLLSTLLFYGALLLMVLGAAAMLYRYLAFRYSLDPVPELPTHRAAAEPVERPAFAHDPRRRPAPPPAQTIQVAEAEAGEDSSSSASPEELLGAAAKALRQSDDWVTLRGLARALQADEAATEQALESLVDAGRAQEAKASDGQTVYRQAR